MRELQNCIERAVILCDGDIIEPRHLNLSLHTRAAAPAPIDPWAGHDLSGSLNETVDRITMQAARRKIERELALAKGNKQQAADALRIAYRVLLQKMKEHGLDLG